LAFRRLDLEPLLRRVQNSGGIVIGRSHASTSVVVRTFRTCSERSGLPRGPGLR
jgi:hypothetical protein